jgi:hypothetical protein
MLFEVDLLWGGFWVWVGGFLALFGLILVVVVEVGWWACWFVDGCFGFGGGVELCVWAWVFDVVCLWWVWCDVWSCFCVLGMVDFGRFGCCGGCVWSGWWVF